MKKLITIDHRGPIWLKHGIIGPIVTPYLEEVGLIKVMVRQGLKVYEVLNNDEKILLTMENIETDNNGSGLDVDRVDGYDANVIDPVFSTAPANLVVEPVKEEVVTTEEPVVQQKAGKKGGK